MNPDQEVRQAAGRVSITFITLEDPTATLRHDLPPPIGWVVAVRDRTREASPPQWVDRPAFRATDLSKAYREFAPCNKRKRIPAERHELLGCSVRLTHFPNLDSGQNISNWVEFRSSRNGKGLNEIRFFRGKRSCLFLPHLPAIDRRARGIERMRSLRRTMISVRLITSGPTTSSEGSSAGVGWGPSSRSRALQMVNPTP